MYVLKDGRIAERGSYESLLRNDGEFSEFVKTYFLDEGKSVNI